MPVTQQVDQIIKKVEARLAEEEREGIHLKVVSHSLEDDWLYVVVVPKRPGERASEYARVMSRIERQLRAEGDDRVLLVPSLED